MRTLLVLLLHLVTSVAKLLRPGGVRAVIGETLVIKHQPLILNRFCCRTPNITALDRILFDFWSLFLSPCRIFCVAVIIKPHTLLRFHETLPLAVSLTIRHGQVKPSIPFEQVEPTDYAALAIPGGFHSHGFDEAYDDCLRNLAQNIHGAGGWIATFCVGVLPVAEAGLLEGKKAVSYPFSRNHDNLRRLKELGASVVDFPIVVDDRIISCAGPASSVEVAYRLLDGLLGEPHCAEVRRLMCANAIK